jgi:protein SCO1
VAAARRAATAPLLALLMALLLAGCGGSAGGGSSTDLTGTRLDPPFEVSAVPLADPSGSPYSLTEDTDAPLTLVFFGYTHCPDICGQVMATLAGAMSRLSDADRERVEVVFVTTDPARDDAETVEAYAEQFDPAFVGLTGDLDDIVTVGNSMAVAVEQGEKLPSGGYEVTHGTQVIGITADDTASVYWSQDVSQAQLAHDVQVLLDEAADAA